MRLAMFSPLSPLKTAIADYTEGILPHLAPHLDLTMVTSGDYAPTHPIFQPGAAPTVSWMSYDRFQREADRFDLVAYQLGDEPQIHGYMFDALQRFPGVVVLHDLVLHHAILGLTLGRGNVADYVAEMRYSYGPAGEALARKVVAGRGEQIMYDYPLIERVLDRSLGLIVHNDFVLRKVGEVRPDLPARKIVQPFFMPVGFPPDFDGAAFRAALGLAGRPVIASYGFFIPDKRLRLILSAFERLLQRYPDAVYLLVGGASSHYDLEGELQALGLAGKVRLTGWQTPVPFVKHMFIPDIAVHLRYPHIGGTPYTPVRLLGLGKPTIVSDIEPLAELPSNAVVRIRPNEMDEEAMLYAAMDYLLSHPEVARDMADNGQRHVLANHDATLVGRQYAEFLIEIVGQRRAAPPMALPRKLAQQLSRIAGAGLTDMGLLESGGPLLRPVADAIVSLSTWDSESV